MLGSNTWLGWIYQSSQSIAGLCFVNVAHYRMLDSTTWHEAKATQRKHFWNRREFMRIITTGTVDFRLTSSKSGGRRIPVQAIVLHKVNPNLPSSPTPSVISRSTSRIIISRSWHWYTWSKIDLLLGSEIFQVVLHGWRFGHQGSPTIWHLKLTLVGWWVALLNAVKNSMV